MFLTCENFVTAKIPNPSQLIPVIITTLMNCHSFTLSLQIQNLSFQQILPTLIIIRPWTAFTIMGQDRTYHASRFIFCSFFL